MDIAEALATALTYEHKVRDHYVKCSQKTVDPKGRKVFATLASEEHDRGDDGREPRHKRRDERPVKADLDDGAFTGTSIACHGQKEGGQQQDATQGKAEHEKNNAEGNVDARADAQALGSGR